MNNLEKLQASSRQTTADMAALCIVVEALIATHPDPDAVNERIVRARERLLANRSSVDLDADQIDYLSRCLDSWHSRISSGKIERLLGRLR